MLFDELDILEARFRELDTVVDRFIVSESTETHSGAEKPLYLTEALARGEARWKRWRDRLTVVVVNDFTCKDAWDRERFQRDSMMRALGWTELHDFVMVSDVDEIPTEEAVRRAIKGETPCRFEQQFFYYDLSHRRVDPWVQGSTMARRVQILGLSILRHFPSQRLIPQGGTHLSYWGGVEQIQKKVKAFAHVEHNEPEMITTERIAEKIRKSEDLWDRLDHHWEKLDSPDQLLPAVRKKWDIYSRFWPGQDGYATKNPVETSSLVSATP